MAEIKHGGAPDAARHSTAPSSTAGKSNPLVDLLVSIVIPSVILMKFSGEQDLLGAVRALLLALAFPLAWGAADLLRRHRVNYIAILGLVGIVLTGGIGLLELDTRWLAVKEAAIPGLIGITVVVSTRTRYPLVKTLLYNLALIDVARVQESLNEEGNAAAFDARLRTATYALGGTFFFSSFMNNVLATSIVTSPSGSEDFKEELSRLTLLSYPMIATPVDADDAGVLYYLARAMRKLAGLKLTDVLNH